jgi:Na+/proline symporter
MFYDSPYNFWYMAGAWITVTLVYGISLHISLKLARIKLERAEESVVILASALVALIPFLGPVLACILPGYLIYRMADTSLTIVVTVWSGY